MSMTAFEFGRLHTKSATIGSAVAGMAGRAVARVAPRIPAAGATWNVAAKAVPRIGIPQAGQAWNVPSRTMPAVRPPAPVSQPGATPAAKPPPPVSQPKAPAPPKNSADQPTKAGNPQPAAGAANKPAKQPAPAGQQTPPAGQMPPPVTRPPAGRIPPPSPHPTPGNGGVYNTNPVDLTIGPTGQNTFQWRPADNMRNAQNISQWEGSFPQRKTAAWLGFEFIKRAGGATAVMSRAAKGVANTVAKVNKGATQAGRAVAERPKQEIWNEMIEQQHKHPRLPVKSAPRANPDTPHDDPLDLDRFTPQYRRGAKGNSYNTTAQTQVDMPRALPRTTPAPGAPGATGAGDTAVLPTVQTNMNPTVPAPQRSLPRSMADYGGWGALAGGLGGGYMGMTAERDTGRQAAGTMAGAGIGAGLGGALATFGRYALR